MQRWTVTAVAALAALAIGWLAPALADQNVTRHYYTELYRFPEGGFPLSATMDLTFREDGSLVGYYKPTDGGVRPVAGQLSGTRITLDRSFGNQVYSFRGLPIPNDSTLPRGP